jgi:gamma-glutamylcyclotransferase (GGCT)/AIG2-like uncharacterized protein YtfP
MQDELPLFVYGTLMHGHSQSGLVDHLERVQAKMQGHLFHLAAGYPAARPASDGWVFGELVSSPSTRLLQLLDMYEGVSERLYERITTDVQMGLLRKRAWVYIMRHPERRGGRRIRSGHWKPFNQR